MVLEQEDMGLIGTPVWVSFGDFDMFVREDLRRLDVVDTFVRYSKSVDLVTSDFDRFNVTRLTVDDRGARRGQRG